MKYEAWRRIKRTQTEFQNTLYTLADIFNRIAFSSGSDKDKYVSRMHQFQESKEYSNFVYSAVRRMVTPLAVGNMRTWREASKKATRSPLLYRLLMKEINSGIKDDIEEYIELNASLIKTLPSDTALKVVKDISDLALKGLRATEIEKVIREKTNKHSKASARLIARTEVSKTTTALTHARCNNLGIRWYIWRTAQDGDRVRKSHRHMEGVLVNWTDPPSPELLVGEKDVGNYHAGEIWNCRCYPEPLISVEDIKWPHKIYRNGKITTITKKEFELIE